MTVRCEAARRTGPRAGAVAVALLLAACDGCFLEVRAWIDCAEDADCPEASSCVDGRCAHCPACAPAEHCVAADCLPDACADHPCHAGQGCLRSQCVDSQCSQVECQVGEACARGACYPTACAGRSCPTGDVCVAGACLFAECVGVGCPAGEACADGRCWPTSCGSTCAGGAVCAGDPVACRPASCVGVACPAGTECVAGRCAAVGCPDRLCPDGWACLDGRCADPSCEGLACPGGSYCLQGSCAACVQRESSCSDGKDEDCDGLVDCADPDCLGAFCAPSTSCAGGTCAAGRCDTAPLSAGTECRPVAGSCDVPEACDGVSLACPIDRVEAATTVCRVASGACDLAETCDGVGAGCPADLKATQGTPCRAAAGVCDAPEVCDGVDIDCPADAMAAPGTPCRVSAGVCDAPEICDGVDIDCPADAKAAPGTPCRAAAGACDAPEVCDGVDIDCPADAKAAPGTPCRVAAGACDLPEVCDGSGIDCPADAFKVGTVCRPGSGACDSAAAGACDAPEVCGGGAQCPADTFVPTAVAPGSMGIPLLSVGAINWGVIAASYDPTVLTATRARWPITPTRANCLAGDQTQPLELPASVTFYAELDGASGTLFVIAVGPEKDAIRAFLPSELTMWALSIVTADGRDNSRVYTPAETVLYKSAQDALAKLVADGAVGSGAALGETYVYGSLLQRPIHVLHKSMSVEEYNGFWASHHQWPLGPGNSACFVDPAFWSCDSSYGSAQKSYAFTYTNPGPAYFIGRVENDNGNQTRVYLDASAWLTLVNSGEKCAGISWDTSGHPAQTQIYGSRVWSHVGPAFWYAVSADAITVTTSNEPLDVDAVIETGRVYPRPKLSFVQDDIALSNPTPRAGEVVTLSVTLHNAGDNDAVDVGVFFHTDRAPVAQKVIGSDTVTVPAHGAAQASVSWTAIVGNHYLRVIDTYGSGDGTLYGWGGSSIPVTVSP